MRLRLRLGSRTLSRCETTGDAMAHTNLAKEGVAKIHELHQQLQSIENNIQYDHGAAVQDARDHFESSVYGFLDYLDTYQSKSSAYHSFHTQAKYCEDPAVVNQAKMTSAVSKLDRRYPNHMQDTDHPNQPTKEETDNLIPRDNSVLKGLKETDDNSPGPERSRASQHMITELCSEEKVIKTFQLPREKVMVREFISGGAFGAVYNGTYDGKPVAVKIMDNPSAFVKEVQLASAMGHPNIVQFFGVVSNSSKVFCSVMELMDGGDLRGLMDKYQENHHSAGFDFKIAFHVARALVYLHSRDVPVIHRDLKSKNILLNQALDAKLTDFGVSRERVVGPMTADVGSSLWMAPEVMVGNPYDGKQICSRLVSFYLNYRRT